MSIAAQYWCRKKIVVTVKSAKGVSKQEVDKPWAIVGADPHCDVVLDDPQLRAHLFYLHANDYGVYCVPINVDTDGIPTGWLSPTDVLRCGTFKLQVALDSQLASGVTPSHDWPRLAEYGSTPEPIPELGLYRKGKQRAKRRVRALLTVVGRNHPSLIRIPSRSLSRCHCVLFWESRQLWFIDLKSRTHCLLDGMQKEAGLLEPGHRLQIGQYELVFEGFEGEPKEDNARTRTRRGARDERPVTGSPRFSDHDLDEMQSVEDSAADDGDSAGVKEAWESQRQQWATEKDALLSQLSELESELSTTRSSLMESQQLGAESAELTQELAKVRGELHALQRSKLAVEEQLAHSKSSVEQAESELAAERRKLASERAKLNTELESTRRQLVERESKIGELEAAAERLANTEAELTETQAVGEILRSQLQQTRAYVAKLQVSVDGQGELEQTVQRLTEELQNARAEIQELEANQAAEPAPDRDNPDGIDITQLTLDLQARETELENSRAACESLQSQLSRVQTELESATLQLKESRESSQREIETLTSELEESTQSTLQLRESSQQATAELTMRLESVTAELDELKEEVESLRKERNDLQGELTQHHEGEMAFRQRVIDLEQELESQRCETRNLDELLVKTQTEWDASRDQLSSELVSLRTANEQLKTGLRDRGDQQEQLQELRGELASKTQLLQANNQTQAELEHRIGQLEAELTAMATTHAEQQRQVGERQQAEVRRLESELQEARESQQALEQQRTELVSQRNEANESLEALRASNEELNERIAQLNHERATLGEEKEAWEQTEQTLDRLDNELKETRQLAAEAQIALEAANEKAAAQSTEWAARFEQAETDWQQRLHEAQTLQSQLEATNLTLAEQLEKATNSQSELTVHYDQQIEDLTEQLSVARELGRRLEQEVQEVSGRLSEELSQAHHQLTEEKRAAETRQGELDQVETVATELRATLDDREAELAKHRESLRDVKKQLGQLQQALAAIESARTQEREAWESEREQTATELRNALSERDVQAAEAGQVPELLQRISEGEARESEWLQQHKQNLAEQDQLRDEVSRLESTVTQFREKAAAPVASDPPREEIGRRGDEHDASQAESEESAAALVDSETRSKSVLPSSIGNRPHAPVIRDEASDEHVSEFTSRLSAFARLKRGRRPLFRRLAIGGVWLAALAFVAVLIWLIIDSILKSP